MSNTVSARVDGPDPLAGVESPASSRHSPISEGESAPQFCLLDADMELFDLHEILSHQMVVLHFYPRDAMPSSTRLAIGFSDMDDAFVRCGAKVAVVSLDSCATHAEFRDEHGVALHLLSDEEGEVSRLFGLWDVDGARNGSKSCAVRRATYVIGRDGLIHRAFNEVPPQELPARVLEHVKQISGSWNGNRQEHRRHA